MRLTRFFSGPLSLYPLFGFLVYDADPFVKLFPEPPPVKKQVKHISNARGDLIHLFGPVVLEALGILKAEMAKTRAGGKSELMDLLIGYRWTELFGGFDRDPATLEWKRA